MNRNSCTKIICFAIIIIAGYVLGCICPISYLRIEISSRSITLAELYSTIISLITAMGTFAAVVVALFKDEIRKYLWKPKFDISEWDSMAKEDIEHESGRVTAKRHYNGIDIHNTGSACANDCMVFIQSIEYIRQAGAHPVLLYDGEHQISWNGIRPQDSVDIPKGGKKSFQLFEILPPEAGSTPDGNESSKFPKLSICNIHWSQTTYSGDWHVKCVLYVNSNIQKTFVAKINWDGTWHPRKTEMDSHITFTINEQQA